MVQALLQPEAYPPGVDSVELVETHVSWLFLTGRHVYKVKKPVDLGFLDFTTLEQRRHFCQQEVALNRRMSPEVYLGVAEVRRHQGRYSIDGPVEGPGATVEYAVRMVQLPRHRALNALLRQGQVSPADIRRLAAKIARFHQRAATSPDIARIGGLERVRLNLQENFAQIQPFSGVCLSRETFQALAEYSEGFLSAHGTVFQRRADAGRVRDCHGDLHTAQIFLLEPGVPPPGAAAGWDGISIIDCIEFNDRFRYCDVAEDIAFLAMDLDFHGRPDLSRQFVQEYVAASGDPGVLELLDFFKVYRACVRGKVTAFRLEPPFKPSLPAEPQPPLSPRGVGGDLSPDQRRFLDTARAYFELAAAYIWGPARPAAGAGTGPGGEGGAPPRLHAQCLPAIPA